MKSIYQRHVQAALERHAPLALPGYEPLSIRVPRAERKNVTLFPGSRAYRRALPEGWATFIHFIPRATQEELLAEVGWSLSGRFPVELSSHGAPSRSMEQWDRPEWLVDFGSVYHRVRGRGFVGWPLWKCSVEPVSVDHPEFLAVQARFMEAFAREDSAPVSEEQAHERAEAAVRACLADINDVALPYLDEWLSFRRAHPPSSS